jgi:hypothetical protein
MKLKGQKDTVYILGTSGSLENTPWDKEDCDYWGCWPVATQPCAFGHRLDVVFELHEEKTWQTYKDVIKAFQKKNPNTILYTQREYKELNGCTKFPLEELQESIGDDLLKRYFTNSIAYMIAFAVFKGYKVINLFGIALAVDEEEYSMQRSCAEAWIGYAIGKGCKINIMQPSALMNLNYLYGYEGNKDVIIKLVQVKEAVNMALDDLRKKAGQADRDLAQQEGAKKLIEILIQDQFRK